MKKFLLFSSVIFFLFSCAKVGEPPMHPTDWNNPNSKDSHIAKIAVTGVSGCRKCHGGIEADDFYGGSSGVSCYECHAGGPSGHPAFNIWIGDPANSKFHGSQELEKCKTCHGDDYLGGISGVSCYLCHNGPSGHPSYDIWVGSSDNQNFHGNDDIERCVLCHGDDYLGGTSGVSCYQCHDGPNGFECIEFDAPFSHSIELGDDDCSAYHKPGYEDPMDNGCYVCHGQDLMGGWNGPSCNSCHGNRWE